MLSLSLSLSLSQVHVAPLSANLNLANLQLQEREFASARLLYEKCIRGFERLQGPRPGLRGLDVC